MDDDDGEVREMSPVAAPRSLSKAEVKDDAQRPKRARLTAVTAAEKMAAQLAQEERTTLTGEPKEGDKPYDFVAGKEEEDDKGKLKSTLT